MTPSRAGAHQATIRPLNSGTASARSAPLAPAPCPQPPPGASRCGTVARSCLSVPGRRFGPICGMARPIQDPAGQCCAHRITRATLSLARQFLGRQHLNDSSLAVHVLPPRGARLSAWCPSPSCGAVPWLFRFALGGTSWLHLLGFPRSRRWCGRLCRPVAVASCPGGCRCMRRLAGSL